MLSILTIFGSLILVSPNIYIYLNLSIIENHQQYIIFIGDHGISDTIVIDKFIFRFVHLYLEIIHKILPHLDTLGFLINRLFADEFLF
jgi:hypothetical protein